MTIKRLIKGVLRVYQPNTLCVSGHTSRRTRAVFASQEAPRALTRTQPKLFYTFF